VGNVIALFGWKEGKSEKDSSLLHMWSGIDEAEGMRSSAKSPEEEGEIESESRDAKIVFFFFAFGLSDSIQHSRLSVSAPAAAKHIHQRASQQSGQHDSQTQYIIDIHFRGDETGRTSGSVLFFRLI
jgi:hypothetical protein